MFMPSSKREIRQFHVLVVQRRQRNVQKSIMHMQSCCFTNLNLIAFFLIPLPSPSSLLINETRTSCTNRTKKCLRVLNKTQLIGSLWRFASHSRWAWFGLSVLLVWKFYKRHIFNSNLKTHQLDWPKEKRF